jgi:hypothetical protein
MPVLQALTAPGLPAVAVIGGMAVNIRLSTASDAHRGTRDVDIVADEALPSAIAILSEGQPARGSTVIVAGAEVDVIETLPFTEEDLNGLTAADRLFVAGHRWALDTAGLVTVAIGFDAAAVTVPVAMPAGLVAAKSHAAGFPRQQRRATKFGADLYDIFRLLEVFDQGGELRVRLHDAPGGLGWLVADVVRTTILANPAAAMSRMASAVIRPLDVDSIVEVVEPFVSAFG